MTANTLAAGIDDAGLAKVLAEFRRLGWQPAHRRPLSRKAHVRKVWAVWGSMKHLVRQPGPAALRAFVQRQTGVTDPEWLDGVQANKVVEGLKAWRRSGRDIARHLRITENTVRLLLQDPPATRQMRLPL